MLNVLFLKDQLKSAKKFATSVKFYSTERTTQQANSAVEPILATNFMRGSGGRSSFSGNVVTVFGATGMMGRIICNRLGKEGAQLIVAYRGDPWDARGLKLVGDLGQVLFQEIDIRDPEKIYNAIKHSNMVINCMGSDYETSNFSFEDVHVNGPRLIARIARECNVQKLIHFSALNASPDPPKIYFKPSQFLISKYKGEQAVREEFSDAVIIRPSNIYGESDRFLFYYTKDLRRNFNSISLWKKGEMTIKMPVSVSLFKLLFQLLLKIYL